MALLTPVIKGVLTDKGFEHAVMAQQVFGGHGYIEEWGMSQYVRDARIAMIYEGANGIQALDLVGRKLGLNGGRAVMALFKEIGDFCEEHRNDEKMAFFTKGLKKGLNDLQASTMWFMQNAMAKPDNAGAGSTDYMHLFGLVVLGYMWAKMAKVANGKIAAGGKYLIKLDVEGVEIEAMKGGARLMQADSVLWPVHRPCGPAVDAPRRPSPSRRARRSRR